jgi:hypothetical protein
MLAIPEPVVRLVLDEGDMTDYAVPMVRLSFIVIKVFKNYRLPCNEGYLYLKKACYS